MSSFIDEMEKELNGGQELLPAMPIEASMSMESRAELDSQIATAKRYPRSIKKAIIDAKNIATISQEIAESCGYVLKRSGKVIKGPSVRLAEIMAGAWGNLHMGSRVIEENDAEIVAEGVCWDLERNVRITKQVTRRITNKDGKRYNDDMVITTGNAASSIALRNAILGIVPRSYVDEVYKSTQEVAIGKAKSIELRRSEVVARLKQTYGLDESRICAAANVAGVVEIGWEQIEILIGLGASVKNGEQTLEDAFPLPEEPKTPQVGRHSAKKAEQATQQTDLAGDPQ
jgi:hypothetical protein